MEAVYKETADYDAWALRALLSGAQKWSKPDAYRRYGTQLCDLLVERCHELAAWLVEQKEDDAAAEIYRKWARGARDRVEVSNGIAWLVDYEFDHGRTQEALRLAREAAQVYSHSGLTLLASLLERTGDLAGAEAYYRKAWDRYQGSLELVFFYHKHRSEPRLRAGIRRVERELFPDGLPRLAETPPLEKPVDGVLITESSPRQLEAGLRIGQIIVGLDGYRVRNLREYNWIRWLNDGNAPMTLLVWDGARYTVVKATPENRTFGGSFDDYRPPDE
jgi:tetratricopeptide (TPR) repeat protein